MTDIDKMIREVLEEDLPTSSTVTKPGFFTYTFAALGGPGGWVSVIMLIAQACLFAAGVYAAFRFYGAQSVIDALRWGISGSTLLILGLVTKIGVVPSIESQRVIRELHRLELRMEYLKQTFDRENQ